MKRAAAHTIRFLKIAKHGQTVKSDHNHFIADYIDGMSHEATRRDYSLQVVTHERQGMREVLDTIESAGLRGVVVLGTELSEDDIRLFLGIPTPVVFIDTFHPFLEANFVDIDNDQAVFRLVEHLRDQGFARIGMINSAAEVTNFHLRGQAFDRVTAALGLKVLLQDRVTVRATLEGAYHDALAYLQSSTGLAQAYVCANDIMAHGFIKAARTCGLRIPEDVSVVGFDNLPMSSMLDPGLTTVEVPKRHIGGMAIRLLDDLIMADKTRPPVKVLVSGSVIPRASVGSTGAVGRARQT